IAPWCQFGCHALETPHHIFVLCPAFANLRATATHDLSSALDTILDENSILDAFEPPICAALRHITSTLFADDASTWPQYCSHYYLGTIPNLPFEPQSIVHRRVAARITGLWHLACIRLAGRIWGDYKRKTNPFKSHRPKPAFSLPPHLNHIKL
ncbi:hypothetical protein K474DRAFT_1603581, partial [Panus rudis PR-1116 ss-1]